MNGPFIWRVQRALASQPRACLRFWPEFALSIVNVNARDERDGKPLGCSSASCPHLQKTTAAIEADRSVRTVPAPQN